MVRRKSSRVWLVMFGLFVTLGTAWALTVPLGGAPDEPSHMAWAAAASDGQFDPPVYLFPVRAAPVSFYVRMEHVRVPKAIAALGSEIACFAFKGGTTPACSGPLNRSGAKVTGSTTVSDYNPLYYLLVGWPSRVVGGLAGMYLIRLMSTLLCAALFAGAASLAWHVHRIAFAGVMAAVTPMAVFLEGVVNPNSVETAGGLLAWTALTALAIDPRPEATPRRAGCAVLGLSVLALVRPAGLEWTAALLAVAAILVPRALIGEMLRRRGARVSAALLACGLAGAELWGRVSGGLNVLPLGTSHYTVIDAIKTASRSLGYYTIMIIGNAGWLDTPAPFGVQAAVIGAVSVLLGLALMLATRRQNLAILILLAGVVAIPVAALAYLGPTLGPPIWQGRYLLWWVAGLPVVAGMVISRSVDRLPGTLARRLPTLTAVVIAAGQFGMWSTAALRFGVGLGVSVTSPHATWAPPGGWITPLILLTAGLTVMILLTVPRRATGDPTNSAAATRPRGAVALPRPWPAQR
jgi:predicted membrane protein DUF2142